MLARALIVVLIALNAGVAAWWLLRPAPPLPAPPASSQGGVELQLLPMPASAAPAPAPAASATVAAETAPTTPAAAQATTADAAGAGAAPAPEPASAPATCLRLGPFPDRDAAQVAQAGLGTLLQDAVFEQDAGNATGYRVLLPPLPDRAQAEATAGRIAAAGFKDFLVLRQGAEANGIALGTYRGRDTAERRAAALRAAGFPAEIRAQGAAGASRWWLDGATANAAAVRATFPGAQDRACVAR